MKSKSVLVVLVISLIGACKGPDPAKQKIHMLMSNPDRRYCTGEDEGRYREVTNGDVLDFIAEKKRFPALCRDFFEWEKEKQLEAAAASSPE